MARIGNFYSGRCKLPDTASANVRAFFDEHYADVSPIHVFGLKCAVIQYVGSDKSDLYLDDLRSECPRQGGGDKYMRYLCDILDRYSLSCYLQAIPEDKSFDLKAWYMRYGFVPGGGFSTAHLIRRPNQQSVGNGA